MSTLERRGEAEYETLLEGGPFYGCILERAKKSIMNKFRYEIYTPLNDVEEPIDRLPPQS